MVNLNEVREITDVLLYEDSICIQLCEQGINPEALSSAIKELPKAIEARKAAEI